MQENGRSVAAGLARRAKHLAAVAVVAAVGVAFASFALAGVGRWGPSYGPGASRSVTALAVDPQHPQTLYAGTAGGVFKSSDGGSTWRATESGLQNVDLVVLGGRRGETIYASGDGDVAASADGGATWRRLVHSLRLHTTSANELVFGIAALAVDPNRPDTVYLGTVQGGVFKTTDGGVTWTNTGLRGATITAVVVDAGAHDVVYAAGEGVVESTDGGASWYAAGLTGRRVYSLVAGRTEGTVYAATDGGVFASGYFARKWRHVAAGDVTALALDPADPGHVFAASSVGVFEITNGGPRRRLIGLPGQSVLALTLDPHQPTTVYAGTGLGVFKRGRGAQWKLITNGITPTADTIVPALALDPEHPQTVYAGTTEKGVFKTTDGGRSWRAAGLTGRILAVYVDSRDPRVVYAGTPGGVFKSTDAGASWRRTGLAGNVSAFALDPQHPQTVYAATDRGISMSPDGGRRWLVAGLTGEMDALAVDPRHPGTIYAGSLYPGGVFKSTDRGHTWRPAGLKGENVEALGIDPSSPKTVYAASSLAIYKSTNGAASWRSTGLEGPFSIQTLTLDPRNPQNLYVGTSFRHNQGGVFRSTNGGGSWQPLNQGLRNREVEAFAIDSGGRVLYAGTQGGVFDFRFAR